MSEILNKNFWSDALARAIYTICETALGMISAKVFLYEIDFAAIVSASAVAAIVSILFSLARALKKYAEDV